MVGLWRSGNRDAQTFLSSYDYRSPGGSIGVEYKVNPNLRVGAVFGYTQPNVDLTVQNAHYKIDAFQFGGYRRRRISAIRRSRRIGRAALRRAWASDPAIRDFIGIAENQWGL